MEQKLTESLCEIDIAIKDVEWASRGTLHNPQTITIFITNSFNRLLGARHLAQKSQIPVCLFSENSRPITENF